MTVICCHGDDSLVAELKDSVEVSEILFGCGCTLLISQLHRQLQLLLSKSVRLTVVPKGSVRIAQAPVGSGLSNSNVQEGGGRGEEGGRERRGKEEGGRERREERGGREERALKWTESPVLTSHLQPLVILNFLSPRTVNYLPTAIPCQALHTSMSGP